MDKRLYNRVRQGNYNNIRFSEFIRLLEDFGFILVRVEGSHHIFRHPRLPRPLPVQPQKDRTAKPFQVKDFHALVDIYKLEPKD